jgi:hypothetical protein
MNVRGVDQVAQRCSAPISTLLLNDARIVPVFVEFVFLLIQAAAALVCHHSL